MSISGEKTGVKVSKPLKIVVDADAIIAQADANDAHHGPATEISKSLVTMKASVVYPATAIIESTAYMQRVLNSTASAYDTAVVLTDPGVQVAEVNQNTIRNAMKYFSPNASKKNTLFDCIVATIADEQNADAIFSFDKFYTHKGFKLASDIAELKK